MADPDVDSDMEEGPPEVTVDINARGDENKGPPEITVNTHARGNENKRPSKMTVAIDLRGDVVFIIRDQDKLGDVRITRIRASSTILKYASLALKALLEPKLREGLELQQKATVEIEMPDDGADALALLLSVLHMCYDRVPSEVDSRKAIDAVVLANKYLCKDKLELAARLWVKSEEGTKDSQKLGRLLIICYSMGIDTDFNVFCRGLIMVSSGFAKLTDETYTYGAGDGNFKQTFDKWRSARWYISNPC